MHLISYIVKKKSKVSSETLKMSIFLCWTKTDDIEEAESIAKKRLKDLGWTIEKPFNADDLPETDEETNEEESEDDVFESFIKEAEEKGSSFALIEMHEQEKE